MSLRGIDLTLEPGISGIFGPNGSGKTTLLKIMRGIIQPTIGEVERHSKNSKPFSIGYVDQFPFHMVPKNTTVVELVKFYWNNRLNGKFEINQLLSAINLSDTKHTTISKLSFGEVQRLIILNALIQLPDLILGDEITSSLDAQNISNIMNLFQDFVSKFPIIILLASHDNSIRKFCNTVFYLSNGKISLVEKQEGKFGWIDRHGAIQFDPIWSMNYKLPSFSKLKYLPEKNSVSIRFLNENEQFYRLPEEQTKSLRIISQLSNQVTSEIKMIEIRDLKKVFPRNDEFRLEIDALSLTKNIYHLQGVSGSGKSTLLNILSGNDRDHNGLINYKHEQYEDLPIDVSVEDMIANYINYVPQFPALPSALSIREIFGLITSKSIRSVDLDILQNYFGLSELMNKSPSELSGGQLRKISFLMGIVNLKAINIFDEPISFIDFYTTKKIMQIFNKGILPGIIIIASHNPLINKLTCIKLRIQNGKISINNTT